MKVLVAGASGFLGRNFCAFLEQGGHQAVGLLRTVPAEPAFDFLLAPDLASLRQLDLSHGRFDAIVNAAGGGVNPLDRAGSGLMEANVLLPVALVEKAAESGVGALVQIGSSAEYAPVPSGLLIRESAELETHKLYGATKAAGTIAALGLASHLRVPAMVLRSFNLFGVGEAPHRLLPAIVRQLSAGAEVPLSVGTQIRDFVAVGEACAAIVAALTALLQDSALVGVYNLSTGVGTSVADFARTVARALGADEELLQFGAIPMRADDTAWVVGAPDRLRRATGWTARPDLEQAIGDVARQELRRVTRKEVQS